jgi:hypothetical protein
MFGEVYRSLSSSLDTFLHSPVTSSLFSPNISSLSLSQTPLAYVATSVWATRFYTHTKQPTKLHFCISLYIWMANWQTEDPSPKDNKHSLMSFCV